MVEGLEDMDDMDDADGGEQKRRSNFSAQHTSGKNQERLEALGAVVQPYVNSGVHI